MDTRHTKSAIIIQRAFRTWISTPELCIKFFNSNVCSPSIDQHIPTMSYDFFIINLPIISKEHQPLFYRLDRFLKQFIQRYTDGITLDPLLPFHYWVIIYAFVHHSKNAFDLCIPTLTIIHLYAVEVTKSLHALLQHIIDCKSWSSVPLSKKTEFHQFIHLFHGAMKQNKETFHYICSNSLFRNLLISEKTIKEYESSKTYDCTCRIFSSWYRNVLSPNSQEDFTFLHSDILNPQKYSLFEFFPSLWKTFNSSTTVEQSLLPPIWKKRLYTFTQLLFDEVMQQEAYSINQENFPPIALMKDHFNIVSEQQFSFLFPVRNALDQNDLQKCFLLVHQGNLKKHKTYTKFFKLFFAQLWTHVKMLCANDGISYSELKTFERFNIPDEGDPNFVIIFNFFKDIVHFFKSKSKHFQTIVSNMESHWNWDKEESTFIEAIDNHEARSMLLSKMFCSFFNSVIWIRIRSYQHIFFKQMLRCTNFPILSSYATKQLSQWSRLIYDTMPTKNTSALIQNLLRIHPFLQTKTPYRTFLYCMMDLCMNNSADTFPEMFILEWPRIHWIYIQISNITSFLVFHTIVDMFSLDTQKSVLLFNNFRERYFIKNTTIFRGFSDNDLLKYFSSEQVNLLQYHSHHFCRKKGISEVYKYFWNKILILIFASEVDYFNEDEYNVFEDEDSMFEPFPEQPDYDNIIQLFSHLKNDLYTIRIMFYSMVQTSWRLKENKFQKLFKSSLRAISS